MIPNTHNPKATLNAIGKAAFVNFYYDIKDASIPSDILSEKAIKDNPTAKLQNKV